MEIILINAYCLLILITLRNSFNYTHRKPFLDILYFEAIFVKNKNQFSTYLYKAHDLKILKIVEKKLPYCRLIHHA